MKIVGGAKTKPTIVMLDDRRQVVFYAEEPIISRTAAGGWLRRFDIEDAQIRRWITWYLRMEEMDNVTFCTLEELNEMVERI